MVCLGEGQGAIPLDVHKVVLHQVQLHVAGQLGVAVRIGLGLGLGLSLRPSGGGGAGVQAVGVTVAVVAAVVLAVVVVAASAVAVVGVTGRVVAGEAVVSAKVLYKSATQNMQR